MDSGGHGVIINLDQNPKEAQNSKDPRPADSLEFGWVTAPCGNLDHEGLRPPLRVPLQDSLEFIPSFPK